MDSVLKSFSLKGLQLSNRLVMAPMTRHHSPRHIPGPEVAEYYRRRVEGGVGLLITEGTVVGHKAANAYPNVPSFYGEEALASWKQVVEEVHKAGGKIFPQLWHVGSVRQAHSCSNTGVDNPQKQCCCEDHIPGYAPSPVAHPYVEGADIPHEMTEGDIDDVVKAFAQAAFEAKKLGFDGIEIHGAHGYLIDQFFWAYTNRRKDQYGGESLVDRTRFAVEIIKAIRDAVGDEFPIDFRFSQWKLGDYNAKLATTPNELAAFLHPLVEAGVDLFHCSTRRFWEAEFPNSPLNLAGWTKKLTGKPTITVGSIGFKEDFITTGMEHSSPHPSATSLADLLKRLENQEFDLAAVGRALLADPFWFRKWVEGREEEIDYFTGESLKKYY
ncbi:MAG: NADH oxidase [Chlamydiae bacterium]|nr:NADH oxidase [Chlamydiota bacterium]